MQGVGWYELIDAGDGRRLERFGDRVVDRPAPGASAPRRAGEDAWRAARARFERERGGGRWIAADPGAADPWTVTDADLGLRVELRLAAGGQVGIFPEHVELARWIHRQLAAAAAPAAPSMLNLFASTGATTLAAARQGASVTHVDAARGAVGWARRNAGLSGLADCPIRWIVDDAERFTAREARRGRRYAGLVLDPPSFGHAPDGRRWRLDDRLDELLAACAAVLERPVLVVVTSHTPAVDGLRLAAAVRRNLGVAGEVVALELRARSGARLPLGWAVRWAR